MSRVVRRYGGREGWAPLVVGAAALGLASACSANRTADERDAGAVVPGPALVESPGGSTPEGAGGAEMTALGSGGSGGPTEAEARGDASVTWVDAGVGGLAAGSNTTTVPAPAPTDDELLAPVDAGGCDREVAFSTLQLDDPFPFDVVIVADHSGSIAWSQDDLAAGLSSLLERVHGRDVRFFVLTPTQYGADAAAYETRTGASLIDYKDPVTGYPYAPAVTAYRQECFDPNDVPRDCPPAGTREAYKLLASFDFRMPEPVASITREMSTDEVFAEQERVADAILQLGTSGSPIEQPLCTLTRYVSQAPEALPERAVIVVLSDEDDTSNPAQDCLSALQYEMSPIDSDPTCPDCELINYSSLATLKFTTLTARCVPYDDMGNPVPDAAFDQGLSGGGSDECPQPDGPCDSDQTEQAASYCDAFDAGLESCERTCRDGSTQCSVNLSSSEGDACVGPFTYRGVDYENFNEYCRADKGGGQWENCMAAPAEPDDVNFSVHRLFPLLTLPNNGPATIQDLADHFLQKADEAFGPENHFVETIALDPAFECVPGPGQSYATLLRSIASSDQDVFSICDSYAPALARVDEFARDLLRLEYPLTLGVNERITAVVVTGLEGEERLLGEDAYSVDRDAHLLTLNADAITARDRDISIEIELTCGNAR